MLHNFKRIATASGLYHEIQWNLDNAAVAADPDWEPLLVMPPHPEYPCAHCFAAGAAVEVLQEFFSSDAVSATYVYPPLGVLRPWESFSQIAQEMENARVWAGIHFHSAAEHGTRLGQQVAEYALTNYLQPLSKSSGVDSLVMSPRKQCPPGRPCRRLAACAGCAKRPLRARARWGHGRGRGVGAQSGRRRRWNRPLHVSIPVAPRRLCGRPWPPCHGTAPRARQASRPGRAV